MENSSILKKTIESILSFISKKGESEAEILTDLHQKYQSEKNREEKVAEQTNIQIDFIEYLSEIIKKQSIDLPMLPTIITKIISLSQNKNANFQQFADIVKADASMTLKLLQLANSPAYRGIYEVTDIEQAINRVGINGVQALVISVSLRGKLYLSTVSQKIAGGLWKKALLTATLTRNLAKYYQQNESSFYTVALLHNIGNLFSLNEAANFLKKRKGDFVPEENFLMRVSQSFGLRVTKIILSKWGFDEIQTDAVNMQDKDKKEDDHILSRIVYFSHLVSKAILSGRLRELDKDGLVYFYDSMVKSASLDMKSQSVSILITQSLREFQAFLELTK